MNSVPVESFSSSNRNQLETFTEDIFANAQCLFILLDIDYFVSSHMEINTLCGNSEIYGVV